MILKMGEYHHIANMFDICVYLGLISLKEGLQGVDRLWYSWPHYEEKNDIEL